MNKRKIVFIINNFVIGGTERFLLDLAKELKNSYEIVVVTVLGKGILEKEFRNITNAVHNISPVDYQNRSIYKKALWVLLLTPVTFLRIIVTLAKVKPSIVLTSLYQADTLGLPAAYLTGVKKRIMIQHDIQKLSSARKLLKSVLALKVANKIIANSKTTKSFLTSYWNVPEGKIRVICNGININQFGEGVKTLDEESPTLGIVGRLEKLKGCIIFFEALKILKDKYSLEPKVIVAGDGSLRKSLEEFAKNTSLTGVSFMGAGLNTPQVLSLIDILIVPSLEEGFGLVVLEGLIAKKIIVASDLSAIRELIEASGNGVLFRAGDSEDLARVLNELLRTPGLLSAYRQKIDLWADKSGHQFDINSVATQYDKFLKEL